MYQRQYSRLPKIPLKIKYAAPCWLLPHYHVVNISLTWHLLLFIISTCLWHTVPEPSMFLSKTLSLSAPAKIFVIVVSDLLFPFVPHRPVCKGKACFTLTTWLGHQWVWPQLWSLSGYVFLWTSVCQNWSLDDKLPTGAGDWFPASVLRVFIVWNISFGNGVHWYLWSLNHHYLCIFYVLIFKKVKDQWIKYSLNSESSVLWLNVL